MPVPSPPHSPRLGARWRHTFPATAATAVVVWILWLVGASVWGKFALFVDNWYMSLTMVAGSFIAGSTSEGGGAVAFPVMTLAFSIPPAVARDFSLAIQSVGMTAAAITIIYGRMEVEWNAIRWASLGGTLGIMVGITSVAPLMSPPVAKMFFTSVWLAFAFMLYRTEQLESLATLREIRGFSKGHALSLLGVGFVGGMISAITGSGLDIATFSLLVLGLRIDERIATPTSVILMAGNALVGAAWAQATRGLAPQALDFWWVCVPVVVVGAPLGARFIRGRSRYFINRLLYTSIAAQFVASLILVPQSPALLAFSGLAFAGGLGLFGFFSWSGARRVAS